MLLGTSEVLMALFAEFRYGVRGTSKRDWLTLLLRAIGEGNQGEQATW